MENECITITIINIIIQLYEQLQSALLLYQATVSLGDALEMIEKGLWGFHLRDALEMNKQGFWTGRFHQDRQGFHGNNGQSQEMKAAAVADDEVIAQALDQQPRFHSRWNLKKEALLPLISYDNKEWMKWSLHYKNQNIP